MSVFISYRRNGGEHMAQYLYEHLLGLGYDVFYDIESITKGDYRKAILENIIAADDVIILLPKGSVERCNEEKDMVRFEISESLKRNKNIIPVILRGFVFPDYMPEEIDRIRYIEQHDFKDMTNIQSRLGKLRRGLLSEPSVIPHRKALTNKALIHPISDSKFNLQGGTYVRRNDLLQKIETAFREDSINEKHIVFLSGMGGSGKSELARAYAYENANEYSDIFWLTCIDGEEPALETILYHSYKEVSIENIQSLDCKTLIIVDNLNMDSYSFMNEIENSTGMADILVTMRLPQIGEYTTIDVVSDDPEQFTYDVFCKNYMKTPTRGRLPKKILPDEDSYVLTICKQIQYNTMLTAMIAVRLRQYSDLSIKQCSDRMIKGISAISKGKIYFMKDNDKQSKNLAGILQFLFKDILNHSFDKALTQNY